MEFETITTQEQLDAVIEERLKQEREKFAGFDGYREKAESFDGLQREADGYKETIASLNKEINGDGKAPGYKKKIEDLQGQTKMYESMITKIKIAHKKGIPYELAEKLSGDDEAAIEKDAENMAKYLGGRKVAPLAQAEPGGVDGKKAAVRSLLAGLKGE